MVQDRGTRPYRRITVATDFSEASFQALLRAAAIFPESSLTLFHAYDIPFAGFVTDRDFSRELQAMETDVAARVPGDERIDPERRAGSNVEIEHGWPRSEERRGGKEGGRQGRSRGWRNHVKKK